MRVVLYDPGQRLRNLTDEQGRLHPMQAIQLRLNNRHNQWGVAWTGYIDAVHYLFDPQQGDLCQIMCSGPVKLWEITNTSPKSAFDLSFAYLNNSPSSRILRYSCGAVGYDERNLTVDPVVDSATGFNNQVTDVAVNPQAQSWASVVQALQSNAGIEWFFNEEGKSYWRQVGYLRVPRYGYRPVLEEDVLNADLAEGDTGVVTKVSVRFNVYGAPYTAGLNDASGPGNVVAEAPASMIAHLRQREVVEYIPWLKPGAAGIPTATFLANFLMQQYAANVITGSITIPADPMFRIGTVCEIPSLRGDGSTMLFYISSIAYALQWNDHWTMTLGLTYGHAKGQSFPYGEAATYPLWTAADAASAVKAGPLDTSAVILATDPQNPSKIVAVFRVIQVAGTPKGQILVDKRYLTPGSVISLAGDDGTPVGAQGYKVASGPQTDLPTLQIAPAAGLPTMAYVTLITGMPTQGNPTINAPASPSTTTSDNPPTASTDTTATTDTNPITTTRSQAVVKGTGRGLPAAPVATPAPATTPAAAAANGGSFANQVLSFALTLADGPGQNKYLAFNAGPNWFDCAGLVAYSFHVKGVDGMLASGLLGNGDNQDTGPEGVFNFFNGQHGGRQLSDISQAQRGDLLFIQTAAAANQGIQQGFLHVCWALGGGQIYGANHPSPGPGLYTCGIAGYKSDWGTTNSGVYLDGPINVAIDMSGVTLNSCLS